MKENEDILDIFSDSFSDGVSVGESDWQEIALKNQSRQFWRWNVAKLNVYYVGLIVASFVGTFALGTDYYITKKKITSEYETRILQLEQEVEKLKGFSRSTTKGNGLDNNSLEPRHQGLSIPHPDSLNSTKVENKSVTSREKQKPTNSPEKSVLNRSTLPDEIKSNDAGTGIKASEKGDETINHNLEGTNTSKRNETVSTVGGKEDIVKNDSTIGTKLIQNVPDKKSLDNSSEKMADKKLEQKETQKEVPIIRYEQDTIYEIDSNKVSRWRFKKSQ